LPDLEKKRGKRKGNHSKAWEERKKKGALSRAKRNFGGGKRGKRRG